MMNTMRDMNQFVVVVPIPDETSTTLSNYYMEHVLKKSSLCHLVVIDDITPFKETFISMCQALNLNCDILATRNYKGLRLNAYIGT